MSAATSTPAETRPAQHRARRRTGWDRTSVEWVKLELMRVAYATRGGFLARRDPRAVVLWYAVCALAPWFTYDLRVLGAFFGLALGAALAARIGPLLLGLFVLSTVGQVGYLLVLVLVLGGDLGSVTGLAQAYFKLSTVSLVSMAAFVSLDPEKITDALLALRAPAILGFAVSYGYRMVPVLVDEFQTIVDGHRMRGAPSRGAGFLGWRALTRAGRIAVQAFYPLILNTAKRTRTTVEALETRGFTAATAAGDGRRLRLAHLRWTGGDALLLGATVAVVVAVYAFA
ncbi:energy-coupling factor transport system permease protein [Isoptericola sp. CG 20/1183]|uniref:Energy-coupling factor transport system permease protein n=1 Tax=Isoptericola halotolerans TaxID=300560 RepID=A0ABX5EIH5_9MICO|nr:MULTISPECIES: energy-coupling factor transporter transmembrane component T [Isoptericola]PRZ09484.1 energy-coupling factor transport system permease protein [Isoptericola sp. CG 20/1183]PRZ10285.1 energy-coupling factor transport system permease protein [Isoptericola halotolerans]